MNVLDKKLEIIDVKDIKVNSKNWRKHDRAQRRMFQESLAEVGYITPIIWNKRTGNLIDGELRYTETKAMGAETIEALVVDVSLEEEHKILALLDQVSNGAAMDTEAYSKLVSDIAFKQEQLTKDLKLKYEKTKEQKTEREHAEFELMPEMLLETDYIILVFKDPINMAAAKDMFGVERKIDRYNGSKGECRAVDGDAWLAARDKK